MGSSGIWEVPVTAEPRLKPTAPPLEEEEEDKITTVTEDDLRNFEVGMAVPDESTRGGKTRINCCAGLLKDCLKLIDKEADKVLQHEDLEDMDINTLKMIVCRESLGVKSEVEVFQALIRWSGRECKRQKLEVTIPNRRHVLEGAQFLVRYLTLTPAEFNKACGLLLEDEKEACLSAIIRGESAGVTFPDHLSDCLGIMATARRLPKGSRLGRRDSKQGGDGGSKRFRLRKAAGTKKSERASEATAEDSKMLERAERDRWKVQQLRERGREKFNLIEEFFICLACIFD